MKTHLPNLRSKKAVVLTIVALAAIGGGVGGAIAAGGSDPAAEKQAFLADAANRLNVTPQKLESALKEAAKARVDAAVAAGRLTKEQGDRAKAEIDAGRLGALGGPGHFGHDGHHGSPAGLLESAATYLGVTPQALADDLRQGPKSLADVAKAKGKSLDGLKSAIVAGAKTHLDQAVADKRLTAEQAAQRLDDLKSKIDDIVTQTPPAGGHGFGGRHGPGGMNGFHGPDGPHGFDGLRPNA